MIRPFTDQDVLSSEMGIPKFLAGSMRGLTVSREETSSI